MITFRTFTRIANGAIPKADYDYRQGSIVGIDLSLQNTGVSILWGGLYYAYILEERGRGATRLISYRDQIQSLIESYNPSCGVIEGYSYGSKGKLFDIGELGGIARCVLKEASIDTLIVPPKTLKQFLTGNGNADKVKMIKELHDKYGVDIPQHDKADAMAAALFGAAYYFDGGMSGMYDADVLSGASWLT